MNKEVIIGIYSIVCVATGKVYIGQSIDIYRRWYGYINGKCESQIKLYNTLMKYGVDNHEFLIVEKCDAAQLNERERYWQDHFDAIGRNGLNCLLTKTTDKSGKVSDETCKKISIAKKGQKRAPFSDETKHRMSIVRKGKKHSVEHVKNQAISQTGNRYGPKSDVIKLKLSIANKGKSHATWKPRTRKPHVKKKITSCNVATGT